MSHVVCLMTDNGRSASFQWSEGPAAFDPYVLEGMDYEGKNGFKQLAETARGMLANLIKDYLYAEARVPESTLELAKAGYKLHEKLFPEDDPKAAQVRKWLDKLASENAVNSIEIVVASPWSLPWNVIYDRKPTKEDFLGDNPNPDRWRPFWGLKYNMCGGRKVDPLRRMPILRDPHVLFVVDPQIRDGLPEDQRQSLAEFIHAHNLHVVHTKDDLEKAIEDRRPDLLYWLSHASPEALVLSGEDISPSDLRELLRRKADDTVRFAGLAFLNACQTAEVAGKEGSFFEALDKAGFAGMIGTEHQTIDTFANPLGLDFLKAVLDDGQTVGAALWRLRQEGVPLGLLYGTYCPPDIRVQRGETGPSVDIREVARMEGVALSATATAGPKAVQPPPEPLPSQPPPPLPPEPYPSLAFYERKDRALFAGREDDVERFAAMLDDAETRILVLHGESGVGKSSFLHAGVIPYLEEDCLGYRFLRDRQADGAGDQGSVIFVRATQDMFGQLAQALCQFCARPYEYPTPLGETVSADLPGVLREFAGEAAHPATVRSLLHDDRSALGQILSAISKCLPFTVILVIDQGEEVFTLAQSPEEQQRGRQALDMLRQTVSAAGDFKVILALRTEYYGRVIDRLRRGLHDTGSIREYLLTDFDEDDLTEAIRRPTSAEPIPYAVDIPFEKYGFRYAPGAAEEIARRLTRYTTQRRDSVLPLMQVICTQLYRKGRQRPDRTVTLADLEAIGGIEGGMRNHVEGLLKDLLQGQPLDRWAVRRLFTRLYNQQADGTLTTALLAEDKVRAQWTGRMPFDDFLRSSRDLRLLKINTLRIGMDEERPHVSLGHDALAKIAADWDEQFRQGAHVRRFLLWIGGLAVIVVGVTLLAAWALATKAELARLNDELLTTQKAEIVARTAAEGQAVAARHNLSKSLAARAAATRESSPRQSLELAVEAVHVWLDAKDPPVREAEQELRRSLEGFPGYQLNGHHASVTALATSPDSMHLVTASEDGTVLLWNMSDHGPTGESRHLRKHTQRVNAVEFSSDGRWLVTAGADGTAYVYRHGDDGFQEMAALDYGGPVFAASVSPDGRWLTTAGANDENDTPVVWDLNCGDPRTSRRNLHRHTRSTNAVAFNDRWLATGGGDHVFVYDLTLPDPFQDYTHCLVPVKGKSVRKLYFIPATQKLICNTSDCATIWNLDENKPHQNAKVIEGDDPWQVQTALSPNGEWFARNDGKGNFRLWTLKHDCQEALVPETQIRNDVTALQFTPDNTTLVCCEADGALRLCKKAPGDPWKFIVRLKGHDNAITAAVVTPNGRWLITGGADHKVRVFDVSLHNPSQQKVASARPGAIASNGPLFAYAGNERALLCDLRIGDPLQNARELSDSAGVSRIAMTPNGDYLFTADDNGGIRRWNLHETQFARKGETYAKSGDGSATGPLAAMCVTNDSSWLIITRRNGSIQLLSTLDRRLVCSLPGHQSAVWRLWQSSPVRWLVTAGDERGKLWLWDLSANNIAESGVQLPNHRGYISSAVFSHENSRLWTCDEDRVISWDLSADRPAQNGRMVKVEERPQELLVSNDRWLIINHGFGGVRVHRLGKNGVIAPGQNWGGSRAALSNDGRWLAINGGSSMVDGASLLFDMTQEDPKTAAAPLGQVLGDFYFSDDSQLLVAWSFGGLSMAGTGRMWRLRDMKAGTTELQGIDLGAFGTRSDVVGRRPILFSDRWLVTVQREGTLQLWALRLQDLLEDAARRLRPE